MPAMDIDLLRELLRYGPETGAFLWRERQPHHFVQPNARRQLDEDQLQDAADKWNDTNAGMPALTTQGPRGCRTGVIKGKTYQAHIVAYAMHWGHAPEGQIDHYDTDRANNAIGNLRDVDRKMAGIIRRVRGETGCKLWGVRPKTLWGLTWRYSADIQYECQEGMVVADSDAVMARADVDEGFASLRHDVSPTSPTGSTPTSESSLDAPANPLARGSSGVEPTVPTQGK